MNYKIVFTTGHTYDEQMFEKQVRGDILIVSQDGIYYRPLYITIDRLKSEFESDKICYLEENMVLLHEITKNNILRSIQELHQWLFYERWSVLSDDLIEKYFYPKESWVVYEVTIDDLIDR